MKDGFTEVYEKNGWGGEVSRSGKGSDLVHTTVLRQKLKHLVETMKIKTLTDAACGDFNWMKEIIDTLNLDQYSGIDIVDAMITDLRAKHQRGGVTFYRMDITVDVVPKADIILCRDCLMHLPHNSIVSAVRNFIASGSTYLLMTSFMNEDRAYSDIIGMGWRPINFNREPFSLLAPLYVINEECQQEGGIWRDKSLCLWNMESVRI